MNRKQTVVLLVVANLCVFPAHFILGAINWSLFEQIPLLKAEVETSQTRYRVVEASNRLTDERHGELVKETNAVIHGLALKMFEKATRLAVPFLEQDVDRDYWKLFKKLHLSPQDADKLRHLITLPKFDSKLTPVVPREIAAIAMIQFPIVINSSTYDKDISELLGESSYQDYVEFTKRIPAVKEVGDVANYVNALASPLSESQIDNLTDVSRGITPPKSPPLTASPEERNRFFEQLDHRDSELLDKSKPYLSDEQLAAMARYLQSTGNAAKARYKLYGH